MSQPFVLFGRVQSSQLWTSVYNHHLSDPMRRAAIRAFRTARRYPARRTITTGRVGSFTSSHPTGLRSASSSSRPDLAARPVNSSMYFRRFSVALASTLVGYGAWYGYQNPAIYDVVNKANPFTTSGAQIRSFTSTAVYSNPPQPIKGGAVPEAAVAEPTRKAIIVTADSIYTGSIEGDEPISKYTGDDSGRKVLEMITPKQATEKLRKSEESYFVGRGKGVVRYDVVQMPSNDPIEDDHSEKIVEVPQSSAAAAGQDGSSDWMFWGVYDGHSGWTTSAKLRQTLINYVARELNATYKAAAGANPSLSSPSSEAIEAAMKLGFNRLDHEIVHESVEKVLKANSKLVAAELLAPALSGACALLSFYDSKSKLLRVACTGDSRAVLGRRGPSGKWVAQPLSVDQTGSNPDEAARVRKQHPGEDNAIRHGRILGGLEPSRAFGDASYKWSVEVATRMKNSFFGRTPSNLLKTPPYVTAEPVVTTTKIEPEKGDFLVMATDGLWEMLTNEEVVGLVGQWIEKQSSETTGDSTANSWLRMFSNQKKGLPVEHTQGTSDMSVDGQKTPIRQRQWGVEGDEDQRFVVEDKNVATHLVRNALGGKNSEMVCALLTLPSPYARRYRDDLTVEVIFFGTGDHSGNVTLNEDASAASPKPKL